MRSVYALALLKATAGALNRTPSCDYKTETLTRRDLRSKHLFGYVKVHIAASLRFWIPVADRLVIDSLVRECEPSDSVRGSPGMARMRCGDCTDNDLYV